MRWICLYYVQTQFSTSILKSLKQKLREELLEWNIQGCSKDEHDEIGQKVLFLGPSWERDESSTNQSWEPLDGLKNFSNNISHARMLPFSLTV